MNPIPLKPYSTDSSERDGIVIWIALVSIITAYMIYWLLRPLDWSYSWFIDPPSAIVVYTFLQRWFGSRLWTVPLLRKICGIEIPDLSGPWVGSFRSSFDEFQTERSCRAQIKQNWYTMSIIYCAENSESVSIMAGISVKNATGAQLSYCYVNRAKYDQQLADHDGAQYLTLTHEHGQQKLAGEYYTNRKDGQTRGFVTLYRSQDQ